MDKELAYLLGMFYGNGTLHEYGVDTVFSFRIPHKVLEADGVDVRVYVSASVNDLRNYIEPYTGRILKHSEGKSYTEISFVVPTLDTFTVNFKKYLGGATSCRDIRIVNEIYKWSTDNKLQFLKGFGDVTGYVRESNKAYVSKSTKGSNRVYLEIPQNWFLVADICNLLKDVGVPVMTVDWGHPNMRDPKLKRYNAGQVRFWNKEHQIKIWCQNYQLIGFEVLHKNKKLSEMAKENTDNTKASKLISDKQFYWEKGTRKSEKLSHPGENDAALPVQVRRHFDNWQEIAKVLGYKE